MSAHAAVTSPTERAAAGARGAVRRLLHVLDWLEGKAEEVCARVRGEMEAWVKRHGPAVQADRLSRAFDRATRALLMIVLLQQQLIADPGRLERERAEAAARAGLQPPPEDAEREPQPEQAELSQELNERHQVRAERLARSDAAELARLDAYVRSHTVDGLLARFCRDLGVRPEWVRQVVEAWETANTDLPPLGELPAEGRGRGRPPRCRSVLFVGCADTSPRGKALSSPESG